MSMSRGRRQRFALEVSVRVRGLYSTLEKLLLRFSFTSAISDLRQTLRR